MKQTKLWIGFLGICLMAAARHEALAAITIQDGIPWVYSVSNNFAGGGATILHGPGCGNVTIPSKLDGYPVTNIVDSAFYGCSGLTSVTIGNSVTSIGDHVFYGCSGLTSVTLPDSVKNIGIYAFGYCSGLTNVTIPDSVTSIGAGAFSGCSGLKTLYAPESWKTKYVYGMFWSGYADVPEDCEIIYYAPARTRTGVPYT